jgi:intracellular sulfur oxidation DsrE/DsrF family protein
MKKSLWTGLLASALMLLNTSVFAAGDHKFVLQVSDGNPATFTQVLNVAGNLQKAYGLPNVEVEIVAFGYGLNMLIPKKAKDKTKKEMDAAKAQEVIQQRIDGLAANQVAFAACETTIKGMTKKLGHAPALNKNAVIAKGGGIVRIAELVGKGYILVRP